MPSLSHTEHQSSTVASVRSQKFPLGKTPVIPVLARLEIPIQATSTRVKSITKLPNPASPVVLRRNQTRREVNWVGWYLKLLSLPFVPTS